MKIALAQLNYTVNHLVSNKQIIIDTIGRAKDSDVDLVVFSELSICGHPPYDLLHRKEFIDKCMAVTNEIAKHCVGIAAIVGTPALNSKTTNSKPHNSAYLLANGTIADVYHKVQLSTHPFFDERRYFTPGEKFKRFEVNGTSIAITIGNELWYSPNNTNPNILKEFTTHRPELILNISSVPLSIDTDNHLLMSLMGQVKQLGIPVIQINQVGANTDLIFPGCSRVFSAAGKIILECKPFEEDFLIVDTHEIASHSPIGSSLDTTNRIRIIHDALVLGIRDFVHKLGFSRATLGLSGGIDSAVVAVLAQRALGSGNVRALILPSQYSSLQSMEEAIQLAKTLDIEYNTISISEAFNAVRSSMADVFGKLPEDSTEENMQARVRGIMLMALSNKLGYLLLNTSNKSEAAVGYGTLYGDMCGALGVLGDIYKTDVYALARYINRDQEIIPTNTIVKPPSAELRSNQKDSDSLPEYDVLDPILYRYIECNKSPDKIKGEGFDPEIVNQTVRLVNNSEYKRYQSPPVLRVSSRALGIGRRMPMVAKH